MNSYLRITLPFLFGLFLLLVVPVPAKGQTASVGENQEQLAPGKQLSLKVQGIAIFSDGKPVVSADIEFTALKINQRTVQNEPEDGSNIFRCDTDQNGNFELELPDDSEYALAGVATKWVDGDRRRWRCEVPKVSSSMKTPLRIMFENRGRIVVRFFGTGNLTTESMISLECTTPGSDAQVNIRRRLSPYSRGIVIEGLEPREYVIEAHVTRISSKSWKQTVSIPVEEPYRALAKIQFPKFEFGTVSGRLLLPDGKSPAASTLLKIRSVDEDGRTFGDQNAATNREGKFSATVRTGKVRVSYFASKDPPVGPAHAPATFEGIVAHEQLTDLGKLRIQAEDEVFARLEGSIKYSDGKPVEDIVVGSGVTLALIAYGVIGSDGGRLQRKENPTQPGEFRMRIGAGKHLVSIGLEGTLRPTGALVTSATRGIDKFIYLPMQLKAGQRVRRDVVIPLRESRKEFTIDTGTPSNVSLIVPLAPDTFWFANKFLHDKSEVVFQDVPAGDCTILVDRQIGYFSDQKTPLNLAVEKVPADSERRRFEFDPEQFGSIHVALRDLQRMKEHGFSLDVAIDTPLQPMSVAKVAAWGTNTREEEAPPTQEAWPRVTYKHRLVTRNADGSLTVNGLAPAKYKVIIVDGITRHESECVIEDHRTLDLEF